MKSIVITKASSSLGFEVAKGFAQKTIKWWRLVVHWKKQLSKAVKSSEWI